MMKNKIILGDNAFWGVNHYSKEQGAKISEKFKDSNKIICIIEDSIEIGITDFMFTSHERVDEVLEILYSRNLEKSMNIYPNIPYIIKYVQKASQEGIPSLINSYLPDTAIEKIKFLLKSGSLFLRSDMNGLIYEALERELSNFKLFKTPTIFLHNGITDLILGIGGFKLLEVYADFIHSYKSKPGFITLNPILLNNNLKENNLFCIMSPFNINGFHMNPSQIKVENLVNTINQEFIPMNIFSSKTNDPKASIKYLSKFNKIKKLIIGTSNIDHLKQNIKYYNQFF